MTKLEAMSSLLTSILKFQLAKLMNQHGESFFNDN